MSEMAQGALILYTGGQDRIPYTGEKSIMRTSSDGRNTHSRYGLFGNTPRRDLALFFTRRRRAGEREGFSL